VSNEKIGEREEKTQKRDVLQNTECETRSEQVDEGRKGTNARSNLLGDGRGGGSRTQHSVRKQHIAKEKSQRSLFIIQGVTAD